MNQVDDRQRTVNAKLERLRQRLAKAVNSGKLSPELAAVMAGLFDLLGDEL